MKILKVTSRGRVTFPKDILMHLGIQPGGKITVDFLPDGRAELRAEQPKGSWRDLQGMLHNRGNGSRLSIEELNDAIANSAAVGRSRK